MAVGAVGAAAGAVKSGVGAVKNGASRAFSKTADAKEAFGGQADSQAQDMVDAGAATASADEALNQNNNQSNDNNMDNKTTNHNNQNNNATNNQNNHADVLESGEKEAANGRNGETASSQTPESSKQKENAEFAGAGSPSPNSTSAMSSEQGKKNGGYQKMDEIGQNRTRNDALNGVASKESTGRGVDSMKQMEKDLSGESRPGMSIDSMNVPANQPIDAGGHMFDRISGGDNSNENDEPKKPGSKDIFGDNAGRKNE